MLSLSQLRALILLLVAGHAAAAQPINVEQLKKAYAANNQHDVPLVLWTEGGGAPGIRFLLFANGDVLVPNAHAKSGLGESRLSPQGVRAVVEKLEAQNKFWALASRYADPNVILEIPDNTISLRLPKKRPITVTVDAALTSGSSSQRPPRAFVECINLLKTLIPAHTTPWDPGYVEIGWSDYNYARERSVAWPKQWPGLTGPLARKVRGFVIQWIVLFPSSRVDELDRFLARRSEMGAIFVDGKKLSGDYRWPLPSEKACPLGTNDGIRSITRVGSNASNQAMERTADRCTLHF